ncbi:hypothetical protein WISP_03611 [Willisornis vidua]|uniref:Uncharacterized protein n=1 Tax=Willisornis vidua TaxID=1566151 RepID=A0ABQ9DU96_9PASS|nr:hypothetical protein WISP_03611 [Willisornis vidua]
MSLFGIDMLHLTCQNKICLILDKPIHLLPLLPMPTDLYAGLSNVFEVSNDGLKSAKELAFASKAHYYFAPPHLAEEIEFSLELPNHQPKYPFQIFDITDIREETDLLIVA